MGVKPTSQECSFCQGGCGEGPTGSMNLSSLDLNYDTSVWGTLIEVHPDRQAFKETWYQNKPTNKLYINAPFMEYLPFSIYVGHFFG